MFAKMFTFATLHGATINFYSKLQPPKVSAALNKWYAVEKSIKSIYMYTVFASVSWYFRFWLFTSTLESISGKTEE